jgi:hypothetical protein
MRLITRSPRLRAALQIGGDGGYLPAPVKLNDPLVPKSLRLLWPGRTYDVIIDFSAVPVNRAASDNSAKSPYPSAPADPQTAHLA